MLEPQHNLNLFSAFLQPGRKSEVGGAQLPGQKPSEVPTGGSQHAPGDSWLNISDKASRV